MRARLIKIAATLIMGAALGTAGTLIAQHADRGDTTVRYCQYLDSAWHCSKSPIYVTP